MSKFWIGRVTRVALTDHAQRKYSYYDYEKLRQFLACSQVTKEKHLARPTKTALTEALFDQALKVVRLSGYDVTKDDLCVDFRVVESDDNGGVWL